MNFFIQNFKFETILDYYGKKIKVFESDVIRICTLESLTRFFCVYSNFLNHIQTESSWYT